jgi:hypothetical protein
MHISFSNVHIWFFFKEPRDKKLDSIRCGRRFVSKRVRRGGQAAKEGNLASSQYRMPNAD